MAGTKTNRYAKGIIYKLINDSDDHVYVGSAASTLAKIKWQHTVDARRNPNKLVNTHLVGIGWRHVRIIMIERYPCADKMELDLRREHWIDILKPVLNRGSLDEAEEPRAKCIHGWFEGRCKQCNPLKDRVETCGCGSVFKHNSTWLHRRSKKHLKWEAEKAAPASIENMINEFVPNELREMILGYANPWAERFNAVLGEIRMIRTNAEEDLKETFYRHKRIPEAVIIDILNPAVGYILRRLNNPGRCRFCIA